MAVSDDYLKHDKHVPTENLILPKPRRHFRTTIHAIHWQLRSLIGAKGQNVVYYVTGDQNKNIQRLNTTTLEAETIKRLPFSPRCLVAENGWVCCGGEFGDFSAVQLQDGPEFNVLNNLADLDETESTPADELIFFSLARARSAKSLIAESKKFGKDLVNCITLWFPPTLAQPFAGAYTEPMAVLSNNDRTVTVIKLQSQETDQVISYPDCVNRAIISPDGRLLVAITDDPYLYLHERAVKHGANWGPFRGADRAAYEWKPSGRILLRFQSADAPTTVRGSFAACFSSTGKYLAVGTQSATISLFNVEALNKPTVDPLITCFFSSRSNGDHGAVRDMAFAPGSSDLLAWTEDRGHVGVVDLRNGFISRQVVLLDKVEDFEHITITDRSTIDPRILDQRGSDNLISNFANTMDLSPESRAARADPRETLARYISPLTQEETSVLEAITAQRRRQREREERDLRDQQLGIASNTRSALADRARTGPASDNANTTWLERRGNAGRTVNELMGVIREQRDRMREAREAQEVYERLRREDTGSSTDRRRPTIQPSTRPSGQAERRSLRTAVDHIMGISGPGDTSDLAGYTPPYASGFDPSSFTTRNATNSNSNNNEANTNNNDASSSNGSSLNNGNSGNSGSNTGNRTGGSGRTFPSNRYLAGRTDGLYSALTEQRPERLGREWEENPSRRIERFFARGEMVITDPYDTSGLAWSEDGQILFVGADDGIFELHLNQQNRKLFSSASMR